MRRGDSVGGQDSPRGSLGFRGGVSQAMEACGQEVSVMNPLRRQSSPAAERSLVAREDAYSL